MKVTRSSRSLANFATLVVCLGILLFCIFVTASAYPDNGGWVIGVFLSIMFSLGVSNVLIRLIRPTELCFEIRNGQITIIDLKRSGNGYRKLTFPQAEVARVHYANGDEHSESFIETVSGKRKILVGEIFASWSAVEQLLANEAPEIAVTQGSCEHGSVGQPPGRRGLNSEKG